ncbi:galactosylceramide sulfotransferase-like [Macrobrachium rosenbergii]|uniref:galactosylceramide sulfotransferase-like n=1 Tax=Macrobrachium rosenbergii TaxID=79674 RepID=UPI0034D655DD
MMKMKWLSIRLSLLKFILLLSVLGGFTYLHCIIRFTDIGKKHILISPEWVFRQNEETCSPATNIAFLKNHKCASSAIQNILFRYGLNHDLLFALPEAGNYFGGGRIPFNDFMVRSAPWFKLGLNIFAVHTKWNHQKVKDIMPENSVYITIVREPIALFESLFTFTNMGKVHNQSLDEFVATQETDWKRHLGYLGYNQMTWDFGVPGPEIYNITYVQEMVEKADKDFELVMIAERMEESLVLMSHLLCWDITDVLVLKINARMAKFKKEMNEGTRALLRKKLAPDYLIYNFFSQKFSKLVEDYGRERMKRDVFRLKKATEKLMAECGFAKEASGDMMGPNKPWSDQVSGYQSLSNESKCQQMSRSEISFINLLRNKQRNKFLMKYGLGAMNGRPALPMGAMALQSPGDVAERIKQLQEELIYKVQGEFVEGSITHGGTLNQNQRSGPS